MFRPLELFVGLRYTRAKRRNHFISFISLVSVFGIVLGVTALITVLSVMNGFEKEVRERILGMAAHITVSSTGGGIADWRRLAENVTRHPEVVGAAPYIEAEAMLNHGASVSGAQVRGILPDSEPNVSEVGDKVVTGALSALRAGDYGVILGSELAAALGVGLGDKVVVITPRANVTPAGIMPRLRRFTVVGVFEVGMFAYDRGVALIHLDDAARLFETPGDSSGLRLKLNDMFEAPTVAQDLRQRLANSYLVGDWTAQHANYFIAVKQEKRVMFIILTLIVAVAAFNIVSTLVMVVTDKTADIAILRTLGATPASIMGIFFIQGTFIGLVGTLLGMIGGVALALNVETLVPAIERSFGVQFLSPEVYYISDFPSDMHWEDVFSVAALAFALTLVATFYPAWRASRVQPADALRYE